MSPDGISTLNRPVIPKEQLGASYPATQDSITFRETQPQFFQRVPEPDKSRQIAQIALQNGNKLSRELKQTSDPSEGRSINGGTSQYGSKQLNSVSVSSGSSVSKAQTQQLNSEGVEPIQTRAEAQPSAQRQNPYERARELIAQVQSTIYDEMDPLGSAKNAILKKQDDKSAINNDYQKELNNVIGNGVAAGIQTLGGLGGLGMDLHGAYGGRKSRSSTGAEEEGAPSAKRRRAEEPGNSNLHATVAAETKETSKEINKKNLEKQGEKSEVQKKEAQQQTSEIVNDGTKRRQKQREENREITTQTENNQSQGTQTENKKEKSPFDRDAYHALHGGLSATSKMGGEAAGLAPGYDAGVDRANASMDDTVARQLSDSQQSKLKLAEELAQQEANMIEGNARAWAQIAHGA